MIMTMQTSGRDFEIHKGRGVRVIPPVFRRAKGDLINLLFQSIILDSLFYLE